MAEREDMEQEPPISKWQEIILRSQSGDTDATLKLLTQFRSLLLYEARQYVNQSLQIEPEDALSTTILLFLEFIRSFHKKEISDKKIPGLFKKYLHDKRLDLQASRKRHCPDSYAVDYEAEIARNSTFSQQFPQELPHTLEKLVEREIRQDLLQAMHRLKPEEQQVLRGLFFKKMTQAQLAEEMNYSTRYIRKIKEHALQKLRYALAGKYPERLRG